MVVLCARSGLRPSDVPVAGFAVGWQQTAASIWLISVTSTPLQTERHSVTSQTCFLDGPCYEGSHCSFRNVPCW